MARDAIVRQTTASFPMGKIDWSGYRLVKCAAAHRLVQYTASVERRLTAGHGIVGS